VRHTEEGKGIKPLQQQGGLYSVCPTIKGTGPYKLVQCSRTTGAREEGKQERGGKERGGEGLFIMILRACRLSMPVYVQVNRAGEKGKRKKRKGGGCSATVTRFHQGSASSRRTPGAACAKRRQKEEGGGNRGGAPAPLFH